MLLRQRKIPLHTTKVAAFAFALSVLAVCTGPLAAAPGPFAALAGSWSGEGTELTNGFGAGRRIVSLVKVKTLI
jgi:hypothetical protein